MTGLLELLAASDDELLGPLRPLVHPQRQPRYLRRNALLALGNSADGGRPRRRPPPCGRALADADPLVRAHAVWAAPASAGTTCSSRWPATRPVGAGRARPAARLGGRSGARSDEAPFDVTADGAGGARLSRPATLSPT